MLSGVSALLALTLRTGIADELTNSESRLATLVAVSTDRDVSDSEKLRRLKENFASFPITSLGNATTSDLIARFSAAELVFNYALIFSDNGLSIYSADMEITYHELVRRNAVSRIQTVDMLKTLIADRQWDKARSIQKKLIEDVGLAVPRLARGSLTNIGATSALYIADGQNEMILQSVAMDIPYRIVIVAGCLTADKAARAIDANLAVRRAFLKGGALWLSPATKDMDLVQLKQWNVEFPRQQIAIAYTNYSWPGIDFSRIPTFYFYKKGELLYTHRGWSKDGSIPPAINAALLGMGLL